MSTFRPVQPTAVPAGWPVRRPRYAKPAVVTETPAAGLPELSPASRVACRCVSSARRHRREQRAALTSNITNAGATCFLGGPSMLQPQRPSGEVLADEVPFGCSSLSTASCCSAPANQISATSPIHHNVPLRPWRGRSPLPVREPPPADASSPTLVGARASRAQLSSPRPSPGSTPARI